MLGAMHLCVAQRRCAILLTVLRRSASGRWASDKTQRSASGQSVADETRYRPITLHQTVVWSRSTG